MSPRRRNLLGHLTDNALRRQAQARRDLTNVQRAPVRAEQVFFTPEEARRKRNRLYQNYFAGPAPVNDPPAGQQFMIGVVYEDFDIPEVYYAELDPLTEEWSTPSVYAPAHIDEFSRSPYALRGRHAKRFLIEGGGSFPLDFLLMRSLDHGVTWEATTRQMFDYDIAADGRLWADEYSGGSIFVSDDDGDTWTESGPEPAGRVECVACHPTNSLAIAYVDRVSQGDWHIMVTIDGGDTWNDTLQITAIEGWGSGGADRINLGYNTQNVLCVVYEDNGSHKIQVSDDLGQTWQLRATFNDGALNIGLGSGNNVPGQIIYSIGGKIFSPDGSSLCIPRVGVGGFTYNGPRPAAHPLISTDGGISWQTVSTASINPAPINLNAREIFSIADALYLGIGDTVLWKSLISSPESWVNLSGLGVGVDFTYAAAPIERDA